MKYQLFLKTWLDGYYIKIFVNKMFSFEKRMSFFRSFFLREVEKIQLTIFISPAGSLELKEITPPRSEHLIHF